MFVIGEQGVIGFVQDPGLPTRLLEVSKSLRCSKTCRKPAQEAYNGYWAAAVATRTAAGRRTPTRTETIRDASLPQMVGIIVFDITPFTQAGTV